MDKNNPPPPATNRVKMTSPKKTPSHWTKTDKSAATNTWRHVMSTDRATMCVIMTPYTWAEKFESFERINSIRETNGNFDSCNSCKWLGTCRLHESHESKFPFVSRIEFIRSKLSNFSAHVFGVIDYCDRHLASGVSPKISGLWRHWQLLDVPLAHYRITLKTRTPELVLSLVW